jgi:hypothetical protein
MAGTVGTHQLPIDGDLNGIADHTHAGNQTPILVPDPVAGSGEAREPAVAPTLRNTSSPSVGLAGLATVVLRSIRSSSFCR